ncbi:MULTISPECIES: ABC transporter permease [Catellatospora]|uniref:ABC transporter permease n=2 Tax=Catellatospora TaxID=53365 RepID=A0A8J3P351_9ACTN|nr:MULTISPECIES: ABC transporter permease [Catellatospora]RKE08190.1 peptide/nickel transport system permease protein/oligopeptide transport system permease protein [Catellatospora citrea]GIF88507.1 ABC transporter permease [Catellatospora chokoriensis]GIG02313.1 ABC transporter permease [Catellatospora citrea]
MFRYLVRRFLQMIMVFIATTLIVYSLMYLTGGDPIQALAGEKPVTDLQRAQLTVKYGLDQPFLVRYWNYLTDLLHGDFGTTLTGRPIKDILLDAWPVTMQLALIAILVTIIFGVTAGVIAGIRRGSIFDNATLVLTLIVIGIPSVVLAPLAQYLFTIQWKLFPTTASGSPTWYELVLPGVVLGSLSVATAMRLTRASVSENLRADFVRTARSKGMPGRRVIGIHVLRNSLIPIVTFLGVELGSLMAGAIVTESVFNVPGVGFQLSRALKTEDTPLVIGIVSVLVIVFLVANLIVDLLYAVLDPRIRYE